MYKSMFTKPQAQYHAANEKYVACVAGFGSGKTETVVKRILSTQEKYPSIDSGYFAPTYPLIRDIFYPKISSILTEAGIRFHINKSEHVVHVQGMGKIVCRSLDNPDTLIGFEIGDAHLDEYDILPTEKALLALRKIGGRCRMKFPDGKTNQRLIATTPEGFKATYKLFKKNPLPNSRLIQMSTYSNAHNLPSDYIQGLLDEYPEELIKAYLMGKFVNLVSGAVYPYFERGRHHTDSVVMSGEPLHIGMDFNVNKMSAIIYRPPRFEIVNGKPKLKLEIVAEHIGYRDTPAIIEALAEIYPDHRKVVYPDAAGTGRNTTGATVTDHKLLKQAGYIVKALNANPLIKERVQSVNRLWEKDNLYINTKTCPETTEAVEQQTYDKNGLPDKSNDLDHPLDAMGYRICRDWLISRPSIDYTKMVA